MYMCTYMYIHVHTYIHTYSTYMYIHMYLAFQCLDQTILLRVHKVKHLQVDLCPSTLALCRRGGRLPCLGGGSASPGAVILLWARADSHGSGRWVGKGVEVAGSGGRRRGDLFSLGRHPHWNQRFMYVHVSIVITCTCITHTNKRWDRRNDVNSVEHWARGIRRVLEQHVLSRDELCTVEPRLTVTQYSGELAYSGHHARSRKICQYS